MKEVLKITNNKELLELMDKLDKEAQLALNEFVKKNMKHVLVPSIDEVWYKDENAISYWLLLINGIDNSIESKIAKELLFWKEFLVGDDAQVRCIQTSDRRISKFCTKHFNLNNTPVLIFSKDPFFNNYIKIETELLMELTKEENKLRKFVSKIHGEVFKGKSIKEINKMFGTDRFWKGMRLVYKEIKSFVTVNIKADVNE